MTVDLLIHAIVRQTTILIAQLASAGGVRAPLADIANQVFLDIVRELERQGLSREASADLFGVGLRDFGRKIQRLSECSTEPGRSLWEAVLDHVREQGLVTRDEVSARFARDDESQVRLVLHELCERQLVFATGSGTNTTYRVASKEEIAFLQKRSLGTGSDELLLAAMYREGPLTSTEIATLADHDEIAVEGMLERLLRAGRISKQEDDGTVRWHASTLLIPIGAPAGWEAAVFDHYKALVSTILARLDAERTTSNDEVGGSTYTIDVWDAHPLAKEVKGTLGRIRAMLTNLRERVQATSESIESPSVISRVAIYAGQCVIEEPGTAKPNDADVEATSVKPT